MSKPARRLMTVLELAGAVVLATCETISGTTVTVTCPGGSAVVADSSCEAALFALGGLYPATSATCTAGSCAF